MSLSGLGLWWASETAENVKKNFEIQEAVQKVPSQQEKVVWK